MSREQKHDLSLKFVVIGDSSCGKSSLVRRYSEGEFDDNYITTIGVDLEIKTIQIKGKTVKLQIWDTAGQERFNNITTSYYRGADCILTVFDLTNRKSFENVKNRWIGQIEKHSSENTKVLLVGNKNDLTEKRVVAEEEGKQLAKLMKVPYIETSARNNFNVQNAFYELSSSAVENRIIQMKQVNERKAFSLETEKVLMGNSGCCG